jgi:hypothetical protein
MNWYEKYAQQMDLFEEPAQPEPEVIEGPTTVGVEEEVSAFTGKNAPYKIFKRNVSGDEKFMGYVYAPSEGQARWKAEHLQWVDELNLNNNMGGVTRARLDEELLEKMKQKAEELKRHQEYLKQRREEEIRDAWWQD